MAPNYPVCQLVSLFVPNISLHLIFFVSHFSQQFLCENEGRWSRNDRGCTSCGKEVSRREGGKCSAYIRIICCYIYIYIYIYMFNCLIFVKLDIYVNTKNSNLYWFLFSYYKNVHYLFQI